jgi:hypothetical protein
MGTIISISTSGTSESELPQDLSKLIYYGLTDAELQELGLVDVYDEERDILPDNS